MRVARGIAVGAVLLLIAGCAGRAPAGGGGSAAPSSAVSAGPSTQPSPAPSATPTSTPQAPRTSVADESLCRAVLDGDAEAKAAIEGSMLAGQSYVDKEQADKRSALKPFIDAGGLVCAWGGEMEVGIIYAWAPISDADAAAQREVLDDDAVASTDEANWVRYAHPDGYPGGYAFGDGFWAYALINASSDDQVPDVLADIVVNAPDPSNVVNAGSPTPSADGPATPADPPYLTSEGLDVLRIGQPIPANNPYTVWDPKACYDGGWTPREKYVHNGKSYALSLTVITSMRGRTDPVSAIVLWDDTFATKSGIRVGDSEARLLATYPGIEAVPNTFGETVYVIKGDAGKVVFEIAGANNELGPEGTVIAISTLDASTKISDGLPGLPGDAWGYCSA